ncbi:bacteriocin-like protein [Mucilaginibacter boryungensis]|uniref:Bacteriocin-like protein n=1 Tax=Mucilaginibacter boryungensis TaxID=768480 RepID=A0ABR9XJ10_9SPHI|nr:hypothetical protein [Mucilaginibacter boryungensis]MBE9667192.1 hypothetical protein [Mucilaginibacter boryungensis]
MEKFKKLSRSEMKNVAGAGDCPYNCYEVSCLTTGGWVPIAYDSVCNDIAYDSVCVSMGYSPEVACACVSSGC